VLEEKKQNILDKCVPILTTFANYLPRSPLGHLLALHNSKGSPLLKYVNWTHYDYGIQQCTDSWSTQLST